MNACHYFENSVQSRPVYRSVAIIYFEGSVQNSPVPCSIAMLSLVGQTWRPVFEIFARNIISFVTFWFADADRLFVSLVSSNSDVENQAVWQNWKLVFDSHKKKNVSLRKNQCQARRPVHCLAWQKLSVAIFSDTVNVINAKLCVIVQLVELCLFIPLSVTLATFQGHSNVEQF